jgi:hypothetical protein
MGVLDATLNASNLHSYTAEVAKTGDRLQLAAAGGVTILSAFVALHFSQPAFAPAPPLDMPGAISVWFVILALLIRMISPH